MVAMLEGFEGATIDIDIVEVFTKGQMQVRKYVACVSFRLFIEKRDNVQQLNFFFRLSHGQPYPVLIEFMPSTGRQKMI